MEEISSREIRLHGIPEELPVVVTRYNKPIAKIVALGEREKSVTQSVTKGTIGDSKKESVTKSVTQKEKGEQKLIKAPCSICRKFKRVALADVDGEEEFVCAKCLESEGLEWVL